MWEKRKLTRKSLDELAKIMPVLSEDEQRACIGGEIFYSPEGYKLGQIGEGYGIRVISEDQFNKIGSDSGTSLSSYGTGLSGVSTDIKELIMNDIASGMGISEYIRFFNGPSGKYGEWSNDSGIRININSRSFIEGNEYDFKMTLFHEYKHSTTTINNKDGMCTDKDIAEWEFKAYLEVVNHPEFSRSSQDYQNKAKDMLGYWGVKAGKL